MGKIAIFLLAILALSAIVPILNVQNAYAQSSYTVDLFETGHVDDDTCRAIAQTGTITWLGCVANASTTLRINAMSGNSTIATTTLASQSSTLYRFFPLDSDSIVLLDISSGVSDVVREYTLSGSTITNSRSVTMTNCNWSAESLPTLTSTFMYVLCADDRVMVVNINTMLVVDTFQDASLGTCTDPEGLFMISITKGLMACDGTEVHTFTVGGTIPNSEITYVDVLAGWDSITSGVLILQSASTVWRNNSVAGSNVQTANMDTGTMMFTSGIVTVPGQTDVFSTLVIGNYLFTESFDDDNILVYDRLVEQPSSALVNISGQGLDAMTWIQVGSDNISLLASASVTDVGRYYIITEIVIDGTPLGEPDDGGPQGIDCTDPAFSYRLMCNLPTGGNIPSIGEDTGEGLVLLGCQIVFQPCIDTDPRTNGMGLLAFIASLFVIVGMFYFVLGTDRVANIPLFVWIVIVLALSAFFTLAELIDPIFLILTIVAIIALASPRTLKTFKGDTFGGGSTE